jgi:23S rRNA (cytidine1920-2'-O)/16S rRNA (cytidine1409-2'-O)-methyltransferase
MSSPKIRLDQALLKKGLAQSRHRAQALILSGKVLVNDVPVDKPGAWVRPADDLKLKGGNMAYVSRGGLKLEGALQAFGIDVAGRVCLDVGASTGGFTDCLLQSGARCVYAVDVGYGQLAWKLRQDDRVRVIERTNIRNLPFETIGSTVDLITIDVSFISLKIVVPAVLQFTSTDTQILALIKPQFEVGKGRVGKGGVVRDAGLQAQVIDTLTIYFEGLGLKRHHLCESPVRGPKGNREFFIHLGPGGTRR